MRGLILSVAALSAFTLPAKAFVTLVTSASGQALSGEGMVTARSGTIEERFNSPTATSTCVAPNGLGIDPQGVSGTTYNLANDSVYHRRKAPTLDGSCYLTLGAANLKESLEIDFSGAGTTTPLTYFGLYWGSIDQYNHIAFFNTNGAVDFAGGLGQQLDGNTVASMMNVPLYSSNYVEFNLDPADHVTYAILSTDNYAFEIDNIAYTLASAGPHQLPAPEPATTGFLGVGAVALSLAHRRRVQNSSVRVSPNSET